MALTLATISALGNAQVWSGGIGVNANDVVVQTNDVTRFNEFLLCNTAGAVQVLASLDGMAASGNRDAAMLEAKLREALKPATLAKSIFMRALGLAGPAAEVATAVK